VEEPSLEVGFLAPVESLTIPQIEAGCEAAFRNAVDLLDEADLLRKSNRCARAFFLAHIACEELGKLPIFTHLAVALRLGHDVDWTRIDRALRSHTSKIKQVLFMDSIYGTEGLLAGREAYEADVKRLRSYTDMKNASLYAFNVEGSFGVPNENVPCDFFDHFRELARSRLNAFEAHYLRIVREAGGLEKFLSGPLFNRAEEFMQVATGEEGRAAFEEFSKSGDESVLAAFFERAIQPLREADDDDTRPD
jgi:AbiV family abortive infection protein